MGIFNNAQQKPQEQTLHIFDQADYGRISNFCEVRGVSAARVIDAVKLGDWGEVEKLTTENVPDAQDKLDGLIIKGYETKFGKTNENGEQYTKDALDKFIEDYYVKNKLNIPVTILHRDDIEHLAGRVLLVEVNTVGFYFVCYIPRTYMHYHHVLDMVREGVLQGMSKEGFCDWKNYVPQRDKDDNIEYWEIRDFILTAMSLVAIPANGVKFEKVQQIKNATQFHKTTNNAKSEHEAAFEAMFH